MAEVGTYWWFKELLYKSMLAALEQRDLLLDEGMRIASDTMQGVAMVLERAMRDLEQYQVYSRTGLSKDFWLENDQIDYLVHALTGVNAMKIMGEQR